MSFKGDSQGRVTMSVPCPDLLDQLSGEESPSENADGKRVSLRMSKRGKQSSPTGFQWGYGGSGPFALAHSMLTVLYGTGLADDYAMEFKFEIVANLEFGKPFELTYKSVRAWMHKKCEVDESDAIKAKKEAIQ